MKRYLERVCRDAIVSRCRRTGKEQCSIELHNFAGLILDCDHVSTPPGKKKCDFLAFAFSSDRDVAIAAIEMKKGGNIDITGAVQQLQAGADMAADLLARDQASARCCFHRILVHNGVAKPIMLKKLRRMQVKFSGRNLRIARQRCGEAWDHASAPH